MRPACPSCHTVVAFEEEGGLFSVRCPACGWHAEGTCSRELFPRTPARVFVAKASVPVLASGLKTIREQFVASAGISLESLRTQLTSPEGFWLGNVPQRRVDELQAKFSAAGLRLEEAPHEEDT
jgi:hypothetical protein